MEIKFKQLVRKSFENVQGKNISEFCNILFLFCVFSIGYYYIILDFYFILAGLLREQALITLGGTPIGHDFIAFYSAGKLAGGGDVSAIYDVSALHATQIAIIGTDIRSMPWFYPPSFLLVMLPLSFFPYPISFFIWIIFTTLGYMAIMRYIFPNPYTPWLFLAFPGAVYNFIAGQNGCFFALFLGAGLLLLDKKPFMGGCVLGILSLKPQIAGLLPIALLVGRCWRALGGFSIGAGALIFISLILFGVKPWISFWDNLPAAMLWQTKFHWAQMPTIYGFARSEGATFFIATILQGIMTLGSICIMTWVWFRGGSLAWRTSILVIAILLCSPYLFVYDLALLGVPFAWLGREFYKGAERKTQIFLMVLWISLYWTIFSLGGKNLLGILIILAALFLFVFFRAISSRRVIF